MITDSTYKAHQTTLRALKEFRKTIRIRDINAGLLKSFDNFMIQRGNRKGKGDVPGSRLNRCKHISAVIQYIEAKKVPIENPYKTGEVIIPKDIPNEVFLNHQEFNRMYGLIDNIAYEYEFESIQLRVLLMYLFSCIEGLRISYILRIKWKNLHFKGKSIILKLQLKKNEDKKKNEVVVPIFPLAEKILLFVARENPDNIDNDKRLFDYKYGNKEINKTLKELAAIAKIDKNLTFHSSRRTFATLASAQGAQPLLVKDYLGHSDLSTTFRYIKDYKVETNYGTKGHTLFSLRLLLMKRL